MTQKKAYRKRGPTRKIRRKRVKRAHRSTNIGRAVGSPIADRFRVVLPYSDIFGFTFTGGGAPAIHQFQVNSIFDPDLTATGHQPLGRDDYAAFYNRYRVTGMAFRVRFTNTSSTENLEVGAFLRPDTTVTAVINTIMESPHCIRRALSNSAARPSVTLRGYASVAKICGITAAEMKINSSYAALYGASPAQVPVLNLYLINENTAVGVTVRVRIDFKFHVELYDRRPLIGS